MILHNLLQSEGDFAGYSAKELDDEIRDKTGGKAALDSTKLFQDGSIQLLTDSLRKPYFCNEKVSGELIHDQTLLNEEVADIHDRGFQVTIHGNGDESIKSNIDAFAYANEKSPRDGHRHRIEHVQTAITSDLD